MTPVAQIIRSFVMTAVIAVVGWCVLLFGLLFTAEAQLWRALPGAQLIVAQLGIFATFWGAGYSVAQIDSASVPRSRAETVSAIALVALVYMEWPSTNPTDVFTPPDYALWISGALAVISPFLGGQHARRVFVRKVIEKWKKQTRD